MRGLSVSYNPPTQSPSAVLHHPGRPPPSLPSFIISLVREEKKDTIYLAVHSPNWGHGTVS